MKRSLDPVGLEFVSAAPRILSFTERVAAPRDALFAAISDPTTWASWFPGLRRGAYTSPEPHGLGSRREVRLMGGARFAETIIAWEQGSRYTWRVDSTNQSVGSALVEQWSLQEVSPEETSVTWTFAVAPSRLFSLALPLAPKVMGAIFRRAMRALAQQVSP